MKYNSSYSTLHVNIYNLSIGGVCKIMEVFRVLTSDGNERFYVEDDEGYPLESILDFIKFKDNNNLAKNTLKMYCQHLKLYFEYLQQEKLDFQKVTIDDLALFINWLQPPYKSLKIISLTPITETRCSRTISIIVNVVIAFYDYNLKRGQFNSNISDGLNAHTPCRNFKRSLYKIAYKKKKNVRGC